MPENPKEPQILACLCRLPEHLTETNLPKTSESTRGDMFDRTGSELVASAWFYPCPLGAGAPMSSRCWEVKPVTFRFPSVPVSFFSCLLASFPSVRCKMGGRHCKNCRSLFLALSPDMYLSHASVLLQAVRKPSLSHTRAQHANNGAASEGAFKARIRRGCTTLHMPHDHVPGRWVTHMDM